MKYSMFLFSALLATAVGCQSDKTKQAEFFTPDQDRAQWNAIAEQQAIVRAVEKSDVIWQTGSWQRSVASFRKAAEIVRNGLIGVVTRVEVGLPAGHSDFSGEGKVLLEKLKA